LKRGATQETSHIHILLASRLAKQSLASIGSREVSRSGSLKHYSLNAIIAVGYRVSSKRATQFRIWATQILKEYIRKGFMLDDERLKQGKQVFGEDYFLELLERVRSIRARERRIYQQITDIFAECSVDYDPRSDVTQTFYAMVQNKFHYAITGQTAAEIIHSKADHTAVLTQKGNISKTQADQRTLAEYAEFNRTLKIESDFDRVLKETKALGDKSQKSVRKGRGSKKQ